MECACLLVEAKADLNTAPPLHGCTPLWTAASNDWVDITRLLLTCGADHNKAETSEMTGNTPSMLMILTHILHGPLYMPYHDLHHLTSQNTH